MKCSKVREQSILMLYGELPDKEKPALLRHLKECPECSRDMEYTREVFSMVEKVDIPTLPEADWEECWGKISQNIKQPAAPRNTWGMFPRWVPAAAAVAVIFVIGIFIGRNMNTPDTAGGAEPGISLAATQASLSDHFANLKPLLIEYANHDDRAGRIQVDKNVLQGLLIQNYLLTKTLLQNDPNAAQVLEDIDLVLREITNLDNGDAVNSAVIKELIKQRDILFKIEILHKI